MNDYEDPLSYLKNAHELGFLIQIRTLKGWVDIESPLWDAGSGNYRLKPPEKTPSTKELIIELAVKVDHLKREVDGLKSQVASIRSDRNYKW